MSECSDGPIFDQISVNHHVQYAKAETKPGAIILQLDSLEQRVNMLREELYKLYEKLGPVLSDRNGEPGTSRDVESMDVSSAVANRIATIDDQIMVMVDGARFVFDRVQL